MTPLAVSVVVAAHNPGSLLLETLESIRAQTRPAAEVVVVDDGSADDSIDRCVERFRRDPVGPALEIRVERQERTGPAGARNRGAACARGETLVFLDADDLLTARALELLAAPLERDPTTMMVHGATREFIDGQRSPTTTTRPPHDFSRARLGGATLLRRELWELVGPLDVSLGRGEWIDWMHRAHTGGHRIVEIEAVVLERRMHVRNRTGASQDFAAYIDVAKAALARRRRLPPDQGAGSPDR